jgi:hypothetical protein
MDFQKIKLFQELSIIGFPPSCTLTVCVPANKNISHFFEALPKLLLFRKIPANSGICDHVRDPLPK